MARVITTRVDEAVHVALVLTDPDVTWETTWSPTEIAAMADDIETDLSERIAASIARR